MSKYFLDNKPNTKGNYCLHKEHCLHIQDLESASLLGEYENLEEVLVESQSKDYTISLCTECIDINFAKPLNERRLSSLSLLNWFRHK